MTAAARKAGTWWLLGGLWCLIVLVLALAPMPPGPPGGYSDKLMHFAVFAGLAGWFGALTRGLGRLAVAAGLAIFGGLIEILQGLTGYRDPSWWDLLADVIGIGIGLWLLRPLFVVSLRYIGGRVRRPVSQRAR